MEAPGARTVKTPGSSRAAACAGLYLTYGRGPGALVHVWPATGWVIYLGTVEQGARASCVGDAEAVFGEGAQNTTRIVEEFEGFVAGVEDGSSDLQILQSADLSIEG